MKLFAPQPLPYNYADWKTRPFPERAKMLCAAWAIQGFGVPPAVYSFYIIKIVFYIWIWGWFATFSTDLGSLSEFNSWWFKSEALFKAIAWNMLFEGLGLAAGSGPLTARYSPPAGGFLYFLRPGTIKLPFIPNIPLFGRDERNWLDVLLYLTHLLQLIRILIAPEISPRFIWPTIVIMLLLALNDRAAFLASRPEHYLIAFVCFLFPADALAGSKLVWYAIWFWAATSKLNRHFPSVISVMISNSGLIRSAWLRKKLFRNYPDDLQASKLAGFLAHSGTVAEYSFPVMLMFGAVIGGQQLFGLGPPLIVVGLLIMLGFHSFITLNFPMAVPLEWNFMMVYGGFVLFGYHAELWAFSINSPWLILALIFALLIVPLVGNLFPAWVSFLLAMRFYAGNWAYSIWLFRDDAEEKIGQHITTTSPLLMKQLSWFYDAETSESVLNRVIAFRMMHLHGRALHDLVPLAAPDIDRYVWRDGELVSGVVMGWNFGDGHLHNEHLLTAMQKRCQWESGELRCIFVDPQPFGRPHLDWRIVDAKDGQLATGRIQIDKLMSRQPYPVETT